MRYGIAPSAAWCQTFVRGKRGMIWFASIAWCAAIVNH
jgi:hypothetical protein